MQPILYLTDKRYFQLNQLLLSLEITSFPASEDVLIVQLEPNKKNIGIDKARLIKKFLQTFPVHNSSKIVVIYQAEKLSREAQNALLKVLEEPPAYAIIILTTNNSYSLLSTISSRCRLISDKTRTDISKHTPAISTVLELIKTGTAGEKLLYVDSYLKSKDPLKELIEQLISHYRNQLKSEVSSINLYNLMLILYSRKLLQQNISSQLVLDTFLVRVK